MKIDDYFAEIQDRVRVLYSIAEEARRRGLDPKSKVEIPLATTLAEKVTGLISTVYPQLNNPQLVDRILELEIQYGKLDPAVCLIIAEEIAREKFCKFQNALEGIDAGIRIAMAYLTLGVVSSPIEGFTNLKVKKTRDGKEYLAAYYSGPIRSAGGTGAAFSLVIVDHLREIFGYSVYDPTEIEVKRSATEIYDYHERITNLQYLPTEMECLFLAEHLPVQVDGEASETREVSNFKDLERIETNFIRSGFCLTFAEGMAQKAPKILRMIKKLRDKGFKLSGWGFLEKFVELQKQLKEESKKVAGAVYIKDLVAGRPVLGHPSESGAFRLRYGRTRGSGYSALAIHPCTMYILNDFIAVGTQIKTEKPTKGAAICCCDTIDGPIVKLRNGAVKKMTDLNESKKIYKDVEEILYLGDILIPFGDFANRNHNLEPAGYVEEWWFEELIKNKEAAYVPDIYNVDIDAACEWSKNFGVALHPSQIFYWSQLKYEDLLALIDWLGHSYVHGKLLLPYNKTEKERFKNGKRALEIIGIDHEISTENVILNKNNAKALFVNLGINREIVENLNYKIENEVNEICKKIFEGNVLENINKISQFKIMDKAGTFVGSRMGRPEKAKLRKLVGSPHVLFPVGEEGGRLRSVLEACNVGNVKGDFPIYFCEKCNKEGIFFVCQDCGSESKKMYFCPECQQKFFSEKCPEHAKGQAFCSRRIDIKHYLDKAKAKLGFEPSEMPPIIKGVRGTSSRDHTPENLGKGLLRALFGLNVNKDGTIRFDATELPISHFKPKEIGTSVEMLRRLGYIKDKDGKQLENDEQVLEMKPHDVILPACPDSLDERADDVFFRIARFVDSLLVRFYGLKPFYNAREKSDLIGHLVACIAPHNCAAVVGRIIGFSKTQALLASAYMHAAMRRDCFGYETVIPILDEKGWNNVKIGEFVESLKPDRRVDNYGTLAKSVNGLYTLGYKDGKFGKVLIREFTRHSLRQLLKINFENGKSIRVTESHKFCLIKRGKPIKKFASDLKQGDELVFVSRKSDVFSQSEENNKELGSSYVKVSSLEEDGFETSYCLNVENHLVVANDILNFQCDGDEAAVMLLGDMLLNFSRDYLPAHRGGTQDAPLVLNARMRAGEVDDMIFDFDVSKKIPIELYEAALRKEHPSKIKMEQIVHRLGKNEFEEIGYTHGTDDINAGVMCSNYKKLATMKEKVEKQMELAGKIRAVHTGDVARLIIDRHFIRDIRGNLRKFSQQEFRCVTCNEKYRRPPLTGKCLRCQGRIIFTISEGSIVKYLEPAISLAEGYDVPPYIRQSLHLTRSYIESIFGREKEKQEGLGKWV